MATSTGAFTDPPLIHVQRGEVLHHNYPIM
jgi:hypothetical protein